MTDYSSRALENLLHLAEENNAVFSISRQKTGDYIRIEVGKYCYAAEKLTQHTLFAANVAIAACFEADRRGKND